MLYGGLNAVVKIKSAVAVVWPPQPPVLSRTRQETPLGSDSLAEIFLGLLLMLLSSLKLGRVFSLHLVLQMGWRNLHSRFVHKVVNIASADVEAKASERTLGLPADLGPSRTQTSALLCG